MNAGMAYLAHRSRPIEVALEQNFLLLWFLYPWHLCRGVCSFRLSVHQFICLLLSDTFVEFTSKFFVKVSLSEYVSLTTHQKAFIFDPWVPERVIFHAMSFDPRVHAPGWG